MTIQAIAPATMQNLVAVVESGALMTTSLKVADAFGKRHDNVLRKLESLGCSPEFTALNFEVSEYTDTTGRKLSMWNMTKDGFIFLVMGFTGAKAAAIKEAYIAEFNRMADALHRRELEVLTNDIPFPPVASELHKCSSQQLAKALCQKAFTTRFMLSIDPQSGDIGGHGDAITLYPVSDSTFALDLNDPRQLARATEFMSTEQLTNLMSAAMVTLNKHAAQLTRQSVKQ